jgi:hypothetical protein
MYAYRKAGDGTSMWWHRKAKPLREQLIAARDNLNRELEILRGAPQIKVPPGANNRALIDKLESELREIDAELANLGADEA